MVDVSYTVFLVGVSSVEGVVRAIYEWYGYCHISGLRGDCLWIMLHQGFWRMTAEGDEGFFSSLASLGLIGEYTVRRAVVES